MKRQRQVRPMRGPVPASIQSASPQTPPLDYGKIMVGGSNKSLNSPGTDINFYKKENPKADKESLLRAISNNNISEMRTLSEYFYKASGIYGRLCRYMAFLYKYDWMITPVMIDSKVNPKKVMEGFSLALNYLDNFNAKKTFGEIALKVIKSGCYYGYTVIQNDRVTIQELPLSYCRSRFSAQGKPVVEFNMKYFDDTFRDANQRAKIIKIFPQEFAKGYILFKSGKLTPDFQGDTQGWYLLDTEKAFKFNLNGEDHPMFISIIPAILDLEAAQALDRRKMEQELIKVLVQQMPLDRDGGYIFEPEDAAAMHTSAQAVLNDAYGVKVITTFADVDVADLSKRTTATSTDEIQKSERRVYNEAGVSQLQFNSNTNMALEKSTANDEAAISNLVVQFERFLNDLLAPFNKTPKKLVYKVQILPTTIYNYQALSKLYKEQMQIGFSKFLPQVALGQSQSAIMSSAYFENEVLDLNSLFIPPAMSSTTSAKDISKSGDGPGRKPLDPDQRSDKTNQNLESQ